MQTSSSRTGGIHRGGNSTGEFSSFSSYGPDLFNNSHIDQFSCISTVKWYKVLSLCVMLQVCIILFLMSFSSPHCNILQIWPQQTLPCLKASISIQSARRCSVNRWQFHADTTSAKPALINTGTAMIYATAQSAKCISRQNPSSAWIHWWTSWPTTSGSQLRWNVVGTSGFKQSWGKWSRGKCPATCAATPGRKRVSGLVLWNSPVASPESGNLKETQADWPPVVNVVDRWCEKHNKELELFCKKELMNICVLCSQTDHDIVITEKESQEKQFQLDSTKANVQ